MALAEGNEKIQAKVKTETRKKLKQLSNEENRSESNMIQYIIECYIKNYEKENGPITIGGGQTR